MMIDLILMFSIIFSNRLSRIFPYYHNSFSNVTKADFETFFLISDIAKYDYYQNLHAILQSRYRKVLRRVPMGTGVTTSY